MKRQLLKKRSSRSRGFLPGRFMENDWICSETSSSCLKISFNAGARWSIYHPREQAGEHFEIRSTKIRCESSAIDKNEGFLFLFFFGFFRCFALLFHSYEHKKRDESSEVYVTLKKKKKTTRIKFVCSCISPECFSCFFSFFLIIFFEGKLIQNRTMAERKYLEICMQPRDAGTHKRVHFSYCEDRLYIVYEDIVMYSWRSPMDIPCASSSQIWSPLLLH